MSNEWDDDDTEGLIAMDADMANGEIYLFFKFKKEIGGKEFLDVVEDWLSQSRAIEDNLFDMHRSGGGSKILN